MLNTVVFVCGMVKEGFKILLLKEEMHLKIGKKSQFLPCKN